MAKNSANQELRSWALRVIEENHLAGANTRHSRADNLHAIEEFVHGHPHYTFGLQGLRQYSEEQVLQAVAGVTGCSKDPNFRVGGGYISPRATLVGLEKAARLIFSTARRAGRFVLATGHPGSLLLYYIELSRLIERWGGQIVRAQEGAFIPPNFDLSYVEKVAVYSDRASLWHSHDTKGMELIIEAASPVDLAVVDHGFAGAAVNARIPTIAIMDTNDPALSVAKAQGLSSDLVLIPMDDNRLLGDYLPAVEIVRKFATIQSGEVVPVVAVLAADPPPRPEMVEKLAKADRLIQERTGDEAQLKQLVGNFVETYKDQFVQTHFDSEREEALVNDPITILAVYRSLREALDWFILDQIDHRGLNLTIEEIEYYLRWRDIRGKDDLST